MPCEDIPPPETSPSFEGFFIPLITKKNFSQIKNSLKSLFFNYEKSRILLLDKNYVFIEMERRLSSSY